MWDNPSIYALPSVVLEKEIAMPTPGNICPLTGYIGAEVTGVDLGKQDDAGAKTVW